jgi:adenine-specific DNA-methyltransferase
MNLKTLTPKQSLNKAYLKEKISRSDIELFKTHFSDLLGKINHNGDEEHLKSLVSDFLKFTYYKDSHQINPIGKNDLVIHTGKSPNDPYGVILEVKSPSNAKEMMTADKPNVKALHELILYYLDERITRNRNELKQLIVTNIYEWYIIDANEFDKKIYRNTGIKKLYDLKKSDGKDNPWFYDELKKFFEAHPELSIETTFLDIRDYKKPALNNTPDDDKKLIPLFKILSPVHLLKLSFANDSNTLQPKFYSELLHVIGLYEYKEGSKKLISRKKEGERNPGSLLENAITNLDSHDKISRLDRPSQYGETYEQRIYNVALELVITWVNRILFLKLLEAQLLNYHKGDKAYNFLNKDKIKDFDDLDKLFFRVLAKRIDERSSEILKVFGNVPYLNSSLFEPTELEHQTLFINALEDFVALPVLSSTILKDERGKTLKGTLNTIDYLFEFLNAYDFSSEGAEEIQEDNKTLINASVLGLIFEKINGYKDGSFFTPGFITMYMCRETIRRAVVQKFNDTKGWDCKEYSELYDKIQDKKEANTIINSLKICDPAVGSGHFLVSALNELLAIKSDLNILMSADGRTLRDYHIEVVNDELIVTDENSDPFKYNYQDLRSQTVQYTLFHEKQTIIENCLFGVDINPNSVKICRLRLWIELLKNAYYKPSSGGGIELETLPNIDINIKIGNSLISRFALDADLKQALKNTQWNINDYKIAVGAYKNATDKAAKHELVTLIDGIKSNFRISILNNGKEYKELSKLRGQLHKLVSTNEDLFGTKKSKKDLELEQRRLEVAIDKQESAIEEIKNNKIYQNAFEWRFEFPEVLNEGGDFVGFDVIIGNPPYIPLEAFSEMERATFKYKYPQFERKYETSVMFIVEGLGLLNDNGLLGYIAPVTWETGENYTRLRKFILTEKGINQIINLPFNVFVDAYVETAIYIISNKKTSFYSIYSFDKKHIVESLFKLNFYNIDISDIQGPDFKFIIDPSVANIMARLSSDKFIKLGDITKSTQGLSGNNFPRAIMIKDSGKVYPYLSKGNVRNYVLDTKEVYLTDMSTKNSLIQFYKEEPKILIRRIINRQDRLGIGYCNEKLVFKKDINPFIVINKDFDTKYVIGLLASKFISFVYLRISSIASKDDFRQTTLAELRNLPIPNIDYELQKPLIKLIDIILNEKNVDIERDTTLLEKEIDQLVYQLYGLTDEEIKIVEGQE